MSLTTKIANGKVLFKTKATAVRRKTFIGGQKAVDEWQEVYNLYYILVALEAHDTATTLLDDDTLELYESVLDSYLADETPTLVYPDPCGTTQSVNNVVCPPTPPPTAYIPTHPIGAGEYIAPTVTHIPTNYPTNNDPLATKIADGKVLYKTQATNVRRKTFIGGQAAVEEWTQVYGFMYILKALDEHETGATTLDDTTLATYTSALEALLAGREPVITFPDPCGNTQIVTNLLCPTTALPTVTIPTNPLAPGQFTPPSVLFADSDGSITEDNIAFKYFKDSDTLAVKNFLLGKDISDPLGVPTIPLQVQNEDSNSIFAKFLHNDDVEHFRFSVESGKSVLELRDAVYESTLGLHDFKGTMRFTNYGLGTNTGTVAKYLAVDASGNLIESDGTGGGGTPSYNLTDDYIPIYNGTDLTDSILRNNEGDIQLDSSEDGYGRFIINNIGTGYPSLRLSRLGEAKSSLYHNSSDRLTLQNATNGGTLALQTTTSGGTTKNGLEITNTQQLVLGEYGRGEKTGTVSQYLAVDGSGNVIEQDPSVLLNHTHTISQISDFPTNVSHFTNDAGYLTTEADTLDTVTGRGGNTSNTITLGGVLRLNGTLLDYLGVFGTNGQVLTSNGTRLTWSDIPINETLQTVTDRGAITTNAVTFQGNIIGEANLTIEGDTVVEGLWIKQGLRDKDGDFGTNGQVLVTTTDAVDWVNASSLLGLEGFTDMYLPRWDATNEQFVDSRAYETLTGIAIDGILKLDNYGLGVNTGTHTFFTAFDTDGNLIEVSPSVVGALGYQDLSWNSGTGDLGITNGTGVNLDGRYVDLFNPQSIAGNKTFTGDTVAAGAFTVEADMFVTNNSSVEIQGTGELHLVNGVTFHFAGHDFTDVKVSTDTLNTYATASDTALVSEKYALKPYGELTAPFVPYWNGTNNRLEDSAFSYDAGASRMYIKRETSVDARFQFAESHRFDLGWGGDGGGNFEFYSKNHSSRPGEFRIVYGGGTTSGQVLFSHYDGISWLDRISYDYLGRINLHGYNDANTDDATPDYILNLDNNRIIKKMTASDLASWLSPSLTSYYQDLSWDSSTGLLSITNGTDANLDGRYARIAQNDTITGEWQFEGNNYVITNSSTWDFDTGTQISLFGTAKFQLWGHDATDYKISTDTLNTYAAASDTALVSEKYALKPFDGLTTNYLPKWNGIGLTNSGLIDDGSTLTVYRTLTQKSTSPSLSMIGGNILEYTSSSYPNEGWRLLTSANYDEIAFSNYNGTSWSGLLDLNQTGALTLSGYGSDTITYGTRSTYPVFDASGLIIEYSAQDVADDIEPLLSITGNYVTIDTTQTITGAKTFDDITLGTASLTGIFTPQSGSFINIANGANFYANSGGILNLWGTQFSGRTTNLATSATANQITHALAIKTYVDDSITNANPNINWGLADTYIPVYQSSSTSLVDSSLRATGGLLEWSTAVGTTQFTIEDTGTSAPQSAIKVNLIGRQSRGNGIFFTDVDSPTKKWFSGIGYGYEFDYYSIGFDGVGSQSEYATNALIRIKSDGKVAIGNHTPTHELDVNGDFRLRGHLVDYNGSTGTTGQVLSRIGTGVDWVDASSLTITETDTLDSVVNRGATTSTTATFFRINMNYGIGFLGGTTDYLLYQNPDDSLYMRDITNGAMITTWYPTEFIVHKTLQLDDVAVSASDTTALFLAAGNHVTQRALGSAAFVASSTFALASHTHTISNITDFPTNVSHFTNDAGYLTSFTETDPIYTSERDSLLLNKTNQGITTLSARADWLKPSGYSAFLNNTSYNNPTGTYAYYHVLGRRDSQNGIGALLQKYNGNDLYFGYAVNGDTTDITWNRLWSAADFTSTDIANWNTGYNHTLQSVTDNGNTSSNHIIVTNYGRFGSATPVDIGYYTDSISQYNTIVTNNHASYLFGLNTTLDGSHNLDILNTHSSIAGAGIVLAGNGHGHGANSILFYSETPSPVTAGDTIPSGNFRFKITENYSYVPSSLRIGTENQNSANRLTVEDSAVSGKIAEFKNASGTTLAINLESNNVWLRNEDNNGIYFKSTGLSILDGGSGYIDFDTNGITTFRSTGGGTVNVRLDAAGDTGFYNNEFIFNDTLRIGEVSTGASSSSNDLIFRGTTSASVLREQAKIRTTVYSANTNGGDLEFYTANASGVLTERMVINGAGNVGIGTASPLQKLHITGHILFENNQEIRFRNAANTLQYTALSLNTDDDLDIGVSGGDTIFRGVSYTEIARFTNAGNFGVGTASPSELLHLKYSTDSGIQFEYVGEETYKLIHGSSGLYLKKNNVNVFGWTQDGHTYIYDNSAGLATEFTAVGDMVKHYGNIEIENSSGGGLFVADKDNTAGYGGAIQASASTSTELGYGTWFTNNVYHNGTNWVRPRGTTSGYAFTANHHKGFAWYHFITGVSDGATVSLPNPMMHIGSDGHFEVADQIIIGGSLGSMDGVFTMKTSADITGVSISASTGGYISPTGGSLTINPSINLNLGTAETDAIYIGRTDIPINTYVRGYFNTDNTVKLTHYDNSNALEANSDGYELLMIDKSTGLLATLDPRPSHRVSDHVDGSGVSTFTFSSGTNTLFYNPNASVLNCTINMPSSPIDCQTVWILFGGTITSGAVVTNLTLAAPSTAVVKFGPSTGTAGTILKLTYSSEFDWWFCVEV